MTLQLPDAIRDRALALRGQQDTHQWAIGDFVAEIVDELTRRSKTATVRALAQDIGIGYSTARKYEDCARTFPPRVRVDYQEVLTFDSFAAAMYAPDPLGVLRWAIESADEYGGRPAPVDVIRAKVSELNNGHEQPATKRFEKYIELAKKNLELALELSTRQPQARRHVNAVRDALAVLEEA